MKMTKLKAAVIGCFLGGIYANFVNAYLHKPIKARTFNYGESARCMVIQNRIGENYFFIEESNDGRYVLKKPPRNLDLEGIIKR